MTHNKTCPQYQFTYEIGSGQDIPECDCMTDRFKRALGALLDYKQADIDGIMVLTSRQAIHEIAEYATEAEQLRKERDELIEIDDDFYYDEDSLRIGYGLYSAQNCAGYNRAIKQIAEKYKLAKRIIENGNA